MKSKMMLPIMSVMLSLFFLSSCETFLQNLTLEDVVDIAGATGDAIGAIAQATETIEPEQEYYIGRSVAASIVSTYPVDTDASITAYLNEICQTIVINSPTPNLYKGYFVAVLDTDEINAFATSGGHILITKGLLECADSEDALAAVIAHEIAHIQLQHGIKAIKTSRITTAIGESAQVGLLASGNDTLQGISDVFEEGVDEVVETLVNTGYSQAQEYDADALAASLLYTAGYSPHAIVDMLILLDENSKNQRRGFINTHPKPQNRIKNVSKVLDDFDSQDISAIRTKRFELEMAKL